ncbi:carbon-nitrogen hydrolase family protein [Hydrogenophaga sp.]|uniref:carbon-nitrogen hydrolase family protein n=1 Tax=Hydrogenophaga sp. TaxID=1904254 RepID=UPI003F6B06A1
MNADTLTLALWQTCFAPTPAEALKRLDGAASTARAQGAHLLITPEMALTGYAIGPERVAALAEPAHGPLAQAVAQIAQRCGIAIVYGYPEQNPHGKPFNAAQAIAPDGTRLMNYRKTHLFGDLDRAQFSAGDAASQVFGWHGWRLGLLICYDVEFPETVRGLALQGADAVLVPTANMVPFDDVQRVLLPARALENSLYLAYANACGAEGHTRYNGQSCVLGPDGHPLAQAAQDEALVVAELNRTALQRCLAHSQRPWRRGELYGPLATG